MPVLSGIWTVKSKEEILVFYFFTLDEFLAYCWDFWRFLLRGRPVAKLCFRVIKNPVPSINSVQIWTQPGRWNQKTPGLLTRGFSTISPIDTGQELSKRLTRIVCVKPTYNAIFPFCLFSEVLTLGAKKRIKPLI